MNVRILALETATTQYSIALWTKHAVFEKHMTSALQPSHTILSMIDAILSTAGIVRTQLSAIAFGRGPGSFTGTRLAMNIAQSIAFALDIPIIPISTLRALAQQTWRCGKHRYALPSLDARLKQIYWGYYQLDNDQMMQVKVADQLTDKKALQSFVKQLTQTWIGIGDGWKDSNYASYCYSPKIQCVPQALDVVCLAQKKYVEGKILNPMQIQSVYLRNNVAQKIKDQ